MRTLKQIQSWFQSSIIRVEPINGRADEQSIENSDDISTSCEQVILASSSMTAHERLQIYKNAYILRLLECLREEFPVLRFAMGEQLFDDVATLYIHSYPSRSFTLTQLGAHLAEFLGEQKNRRANLDVATEPWVDFLCDLANFERTTTEVFDCIGPEYSSQLFEDRLRAIPMARVGEAHIAAADCLRQLVTQYPVHRYYSEIRNRGSSAIPSRRQCFLAIIRMDNNVRYYEISAAQHFVLLAIASGATIGEVLRSYAWGQSTTTPLTVAQLFRWCRQWVERGFLTSIELREDR